MELHLDNIKANLTADGRIVKGYAVIFDSIDLQGEKFTENTYFGELDSMKSIFMYNHGFDKSLQKVPIGVVTKFIKDEIGIYFEGELKALNVELWKELQIEDNEKYLDAISDLINSKKMGISTGAVGHTVVKSNNTIKQWIIGEVSLTPTPAEPKTFIKKGSVFNKKNKERLNIIKSTVDEMLKEIEYMQEEIVEEKANTYENIIEKKDINFKELETNIINKLTGVI